MQPSPEPPLDKNTLDVSRIFSTYLAFGGDLARTSQICDDVDPRAIHQLAAAERFAEKLEHLDYMKGDDRDTQSKINRRVNYIQAHRLRTIIDKVLNDLEQKTPDELLKAMTVRTSNGLEFKPSLLTDLAKAAEVAHLMTQRTLGDTPAEQARDQQKIKGRDVALAVLAALNAAEEMVPGSIDLLRRELEREHLVTREA